MKTCVVLALFLASGLAGCGNDKSTATNVSAVTFWQDVAPIYNARCVRCHQQGGIGPFRLDNYADAKTHAALELSRVMAGTMPPYFMVHDGTCESFHDETTLTPAEKATISDWVNGGQREGTPVTLTLPLQPKLENAVDINTPTFAPVAVGDQLAMFDEYRCFLLDPPNSSDAFLTGYDVTPGDPSIVHHVLGFVVDPQKVAGGGMTNAAVMQKLDDQSPARLGWPCFGAAGEGVDVEGVPVTWAPGQGVVNYPAGMGVPIHATDKIVIQVHYNLADLSSTGKSDSTAIHLRFADTVNRELAFLLPDVFLDSLGKTDSQGHPTPDVLPPQKADAKYTWSLSGREMNLGAAVDLIAVMPHMHGRGIRQQMRLGTPTSLSCAAHLENWSFHWQEFYFYKTPPVLTPDTQVEVTCEYNTTMDTEAVLPGWGTRNEMCLAVLMVALPPS
jgi:Copper type II ascorbate-dependent monooxygenase, C-terminal domain